MGETRCNLFFFERISQQILEVNQYIRDRHSDLYKSAPITETILERAKQDGNIVGKYIRQEEHLRKFLLNLCGNDLIKLQEIVKLSILQFQTFIESVKDQSKKEREKHGNQNRVSSRQNSG